METTPVNAFALLAAAYADARSYLDATEDAFLAAQAEREAAYRVRVRERRAATKAAFLARWNEIPMETPEQRRHRERVERLAREERDRKAREAEQRRLLAAYRASVCGTVAK